MRAFDRVTDVFVAIAGRLYPALRACARAVGIRASRYPRVAAVVDAINDPYARVEAFDRQYVTGPDHWRYTTNPIEQERFRVALEMLEGVKNAQRFATVFEIACAEGVFTEMLAPLCDSLVAVDFSEIALARARERCSRLKQVVFRPWNLRTDPVPGPFDLTVVMDVLTVIKGPGRLREIIAKLVAGLRRGDLLLLCDYREEPEMRALENSWIGRRLLFGGKWIREELTAHPQLEALRSEDTEHHVLALYRRR